MSVSDEIFELVNHEGKVIGTALRGECHNNPSLLHRAVHILVWNSKGELFLQHRSADKDIQPDKWDTSVGGHFAVGETPEMAAKREMEEELGIKDVELKFLYQYLWQTDRESELVYSFATIYDGSIKIDPNELDEAKLWSQDQIEENIGSDIFTPNFEAEWQKICKLKTSKRLLSILEFLEFLKSRT